MDELKQLISVADELRDITWENQLLEILPKIQVRILSEDPQVGPDGWPYLFVDTDSSAKEPLQKVLFWLAERGIGLVLNPTKAYPDYVLSYGMIWYYRKYGQFENVVSSKPAGQEVVVQADQKVQIKKPSEESLPSYARKIIKEFFRDQGVYSPKALFVSFDGGTVFELAFSLESLGSPPQEELSGIMEALSWFFPTGLSLTLLKEAHFPQFELL